MRELPERMKSLEEYRIDYYKKVARKLKPGNQCGRVSFVKHPDPCPAKPIDGWITN